jgi:hemoglobin-like flavoprotein
MPVHVKVNVKLLEDSFARIRPHGKDFASTFYKNLLTDYPELRPLFASTTMPDQEKKLMMTLVLVINNLRNLTYLTNILRDLGDRHVRYGINPEHYPMVGVTLVKTFESFLGSDWTPEVKQAWINGYGAIVDLMLAGKDLESEVVWIWL